MRDDDELFSLAWNLNEKKQPKEELSETISNFT